MDEEKGLIKYKKYYTYIEPVIKSFGGSSYTSLILFFLVTSFFTLFAIKPTINTIASLFKQIDEGKITDNALQQKINALSLAQIEYSSVSTSLPLVYSSLPSDPLVAILAGDIEKIATASQVKISSFQVQSVDLLNSSLSLPNSFSLKEIVFSLQVNGQYKSLQSFLNIITNFRRLMEIDKVNLGFFNNKEADTMGLLLNAKAYYFN